jgi:hypothetical protein
LQRLGELADSLEGSGFYDLRVIIEVLVKQRNAFEQSELPGRRGRLTAANLCVVTRAVVCPDKFRGTLQADEAARAMAAGVSRAGFDDVIELPLADGGEGTLDTMLAARGGSRRTSRCCATSASKPSGR